MERETEIATPVRDSDIAAAVLKPPYRVPSMAEVRAVKPARLTVASLFSGCGGSSLGYRMAGLSVVYANEFMEAARDTYKANAAEGTYLDSRDVRKVSGRDILDAVGPVDILDGSPPCASFSTAGKREKYWGEVKKYSQTARPGAVGEMQRTDDLFLEYARILADVRPQVFVAENVSGLVKGAAKGYFKLILAALRDCGYTVSAKLLDASWLGVPQKRQRLIFVGVRDDLPFAPAYPKPLPYRYSVGEAIAGQDVDVDPETGQDLRFQRYSIYKTWRTLKPGEHRTGSLFNLVRVDPNQPSPTLIAAWGNIGIASAAHWSTPRKFSIAECRRLCGFPDDFVLTGNYAQRWERLGRAVPPLMMRAIAEPLRDQLLALPC